jgi:hypothetical protein
VVKVAYTILGAELDECPVCDELREQLYYERQRSAHLEAVLFVNHRIAEPNQQEQTQPVFESVRPRRLPWSMRRREVEKKHRRPEVKPETKLTEGEKLFEESLKDASN